MVESTSQSPNPQFYGEIGLHNMGHLLIAFAHDPQFKHRVHILQLQLVYPYFTNNCAQVDDFYSIQENAGVMSETGTAMRDPVFYRWHKYVDNIFDLHKVNLQPYPPTGVL
jgi:tyrosinase